MGIHVMGIGLVGLGTDLLVATPGANYILAKRAEDLVLTAGQGLAESENINYMGQVVTDSSEGYKVARLCTIYTILVVKKIVTSLNEINRTMSAHVYVSSLQDFKKQPKIVNEVLNLLLELLGRKGYSQGQRSVHRAYQAVSLPVEVIVQGRGLVPQKQNLYTMWLRRC